MLRALAGYLWKKPRSRRSVVASTKTIVVNPPISAALFCAASFGLEY